MAGNKDMQAIAATGGANEVTVDELLERMRKDREFRKTPEGMEQTKRDIAAVQAYVDNGPHDPPKHTSVTFTLEDPKKEKARQPEV